MNGQDFELEGKAAELRHAFDRTFAEAPALARPAFEDFLAIRVGPDPFAVRLAEVSGLYADRKVTFLSSAMGELLGITGVRGAILPVFDLRALFGYPAGQEMRWLLVAAEKAVGLAFDAFEGHLRSGATRAPVASVEGNRPYIRGVLSAGQVSRPVVDVAAVLEAIKRRAQAAPIQEE